MKLLISCVVTFLVAFACIRGETTTTNTPTTTTTTIATTPDSTPDSTPSPTPQKKCTDYLSQTTCTQLANVINKLGESATTLQDAINAAVKAQKTTVKDMTNFVKVYIAKSLKCKKVISEDYCVALSLIAKKLHLTGLQLKMAIEKAVDAGKLATKDLYENVILTLKGEISCDHLLGNTTCVNIMKAMGKFHEQRALLREAIMSVVMKNYNNTKDVATLVKNYLVEKVTNFKCEDVMPPMICKRINATARFLKLAPKVVRKAIETAVINGANTWQGIYNGTIKILTSMIKCEVVITPKSCENLFKITKKLHEQSQLIKEALMKAAEKQVQDAKDIYNEIKLSLIEAAKNFQCTDVLLAEQCTTLKYLASRFHIRYQKIRDIMINAYVNGTNSAKKIYEVTFGELVRDARNVTCEQIIDARVCAALDNFAERLDVRKDMVTQAVKEAILKGKKNIEDIKEFVKNLIVDDRSCYDFFKSRLICKSLQLSAWVKGITFDRVINKIKDLYASGITSIKRIKQRIKEILGISIFKRSAELEDPQLSVKDELIDSALQLVDAVARIGGKVKEKIKRELKSLYNQGKLTIFSLSTVVKNLLAKYLPGNDEQMMDEDSVGKLGQRSSQLRKEIRQRFNELLQKMKDLINKLPAGESAEAKMRIEGMEKMVEEEIEKEITKAIKSFL